jgi:hypothetical protein
VARWRQPGSTLSACLGGQAPSSPEPAQNGPTRVLPAVPVAQRHTADRHHLGTDPPSIIGWLQAHGSLLEILAWLRQTSRGCTGPILLEQARDTRHDRTFMRRLQSHTAPAAMASGKAGRHDAISQCSWHDFCLITVMKGGRRRRSGSWCPRCYRELPPACGAAYTASMPTQIFISHITVEHELAALLKQKIERHFLEQVDVFVSSDQESIQAGESWLDALQRSLTSASMAIVLCSPVSINRPWLNFEAGAAWLRKIPVVPLCHSGLEPGKLPMPLSALQGGKISDPEALLRLYNRIAKLIHSGCPDVNWKSYANELSRVVVTGNDDYGDSADPTVSAMQRPDLSELGRRAEAGDEKAIQSIAVHESPDAWSILMDIAANNIDDELRIAAIKGLASFHSPGDISPLCELLVQDRWLVAQACAKALGRFKDPRAIPYLIRASDQHVDWVTTQECATALGVFAPQKPETICSALIRALKIGSFEGEAASQSLRRYEELALPYLLDALEKGALTGEGRSLALKTIALIGDRKALPRLEALRDSWQENLEGTDRDNLLAEINNSISQLTDTPSSTL